MQLVKPLRAPEIKDVRVFAVRLRFASRDIGGWEVQEDEPSAFSGIYTSPEDARAMMSDRNRPEGWPLTTRAPSPCGPFLHTLGTHLSIPPRMSI